MKIKNPINPLYLLLAITLTLFIILVPSVLAVGKSDITGKPETAVGRPNNVGNNTTGVQEERQQQAQNRLTEAKIKACQARESAIKKRSERLGQLANTMEEKFDAIAQRVEEYYTTKVVPSGKTVANYDSLVADIQTKKGSVQTVLSKTQANASSFSCTNDDPKGQMTQFKNDMRSVIKSLQDYRTSIKNLIVAVRSVTGTTERTYPSTSPKPKGNQGESE